MPFLETDEGDVIFEYAAIAAHFARCAPNSGLLGQSLFQNAKVDEWTAWGHGVFHPAFSMVESVWGQKTMTDAAFKEKMGNLK